MTTRRLVPFLVCTILIIATTALAQPTPEWNRKVAGIGLAPSPTADSFFDVFVQLDLQASATTANLDLSTELELMINGTPVGGLQSWSVELDGPTGDCESSCGSGCGSLYIDGTINTMTCHLDGPGDCDCGYWLSASFGGVELTPGDEIMVLLRPAPGAVPETDETDDRLVHIFDGTPIGWNREIQSVATVPSAAGDSFFDVFVTIDLDGSGTTGGFDLSTELQLLINGTAVGDFGWSVLLDGPAADCESSCGSNCGPFYLNGVINTMTCRKDGPTDCDCGYWLVGDFPGVPMQPGDEIMVLLRPAPGAAPDFNGSVAGDQLIQTFDGEASGWNRSIDNVQMVEIETGIFDFLVDGSVTMARVGTFADVSFQVQLEVDSAVAATQSMTMEYTPDLSLAICLEDCSGGVCGDFMSDNETQIAAQCLPWPGFAGCSCGANWSIVFPAVPVPTGAIVNVRLIPTPGALPELPPFEGDDEREPSAPTGVEDQALPAAGRLLDQNYPNPFNPMTTIAFRTRSTGLVVLDIHDMRGKRVRRLLDETHEPGSWTVQWDGRDDRGLSLAAGHYVYRLTADGRTEARKMTFLK